MPVQAFREAPAGAYGLVADRVVGECLAAGLAPVDEGLSLHGLHPICREVIPICLSCGCGSYGAKHNPTSIDWADLTAAAENADITPERAAENILHGAHHMLGKSDHDHHEQVARGTVLKENPEQRFVLMVLYSPNRMPHRGADRKIDVVAPDVLEKACWRFTDNGLKVGLFHEPGHEGAAKCVENYIYRNPAPWVIEGPDGRTQVIKQGDWLGGFILDEPTWGMYKSGLIGGASPQGTAGRKPASAETLARVNGETG